MLKPCPFCEGPAELEDLGKGTGGFLVRCKRSFTLGCGAVMYGTPVDVRTVNLSDDEEVHATTKAQAIQRWNRRVQPEEAADQARQELAEAKRVLGCARAELMCLGRDLEELNSGQRHYPTALLDPECIEAIDAVLTPPTPIPPVTDREPR